MTNDIRLGYPCVNRSMGCSASRTFRLASYSKERIESAVSENLDCLKKILKFNRDKGIFFFRISSDLVPFASHPVCEFNWKGEFSVEFREIGNYIKKNGMRVSMHPDQFVLLNAIDENIVRRSVLELEYHCAVLEAMGLGNSAKVQIHVGGVYGDKVSAMERFERGYSALSSAVKKRLVIENDDRLYSLGDCIEISSRTGVPVLFDVFHHLCLCSGESVPDALKKASGTWRSSDGPLMVDYSEQEKGKRKGSHAETVNVRKFRDFLVMAAGTGLDMDIMLEIKDKEKSAMKALEVLKRVNTIK